MGDALTLAWAVLFVQALTLGALVWYALETRRLRQTTDIQARQATLPVLHIEELDTTYRLKNVGFGIAVKTVISPLILRDAAGTTVTCNFEPIHMLVPQRNAGIEFTIEATRAGEHVVHELASSRLMDVIRAAIGYSHSFELPVYAADIAGREYQCILVWALPDVATAIISGSSPTPRMGPPEQIHRRRGEPRAIGTEITFDSPRLEHFLV